jgi:proline iminopeptidase
MRLIRVACGQLLVSSAPLLAGPEALWQQHFTNSRDGTKIAFYTVAGTNEGTPLIVISGGPGSDHRYMRVGGSFQRISGNRRVIMFDQRGTSASGPVTGDPDFMNWAEDVEAIRQSIGAERIDLLGHSFGGLVAMAYASRHPDRIRSIVFVDSTAPRMSENASLLGDLFPDRIGEWQSVRSALSPEFHADQMKVFFSMEFVDPQLPERYTDEVSGLVYNIKVNNALRAQLGDVDFTETMRELGRPVLVVHGRYDAVIAPITGWRLHQLIQGSKMRFIESSGHLPFAEKPQDFATVVEQFLSTLH